MNAIATEILDVIPETEKADRRARLRAAAAAAGMLHATPPLHMSAAQRSRVVGSTRGLGQQVDRLLADERERV
jgi:hypothetical protein